MKRLILFFAFIACLSTLGLAEIQKIYDRFTKSTTISTKPIVSPRDANPFLSFTATYAGEKFSGNLEKLALMFFSHTEDWKYRNCHETHFLIDGAPLSPGDAAYYGKPYSDHVFEIVICANVTFSSIKKMATAKKIEVKICNTEFTLSQSEMDDLKEFVRLLTPEKSPSSPHGPVPF